MKMVRKGCKTPGKTEAFGCCGIIKLRMHGAPEPHRPGKTDKKG